MYRLIIADDEEIECKALSMLIMKNFPDIQLIPYVMNGVDLIKQVEACQPDIAIVDINMSGINGLDAIDLIKLKNIRMKVIINTAYSSFEYVQKALALGADDYILKPEKRERIIATIAKLCQSVEEERQKKIESEKLGQLVSEMVPIIESELMFSILLGDPNKDSFNTYCDMLGIQFTKGTILAVKLTDSPGAGTGADSAAIIAFMKDEMKSICCLVPSSVISGYIYFFIMAPQEIEGLKTWAEEIAKLMINKVKHQFGVYLTCGIGRMYENFEQMAQSYRESVIALNSRPVAGCVNSFEDVSAAAVDKNPFEGIKTELAEKVKTFNQSACRQLVEEAFSKIMPEQSQEDVKSHLLDLMLSVNTTLLQNNILFYGKVLESKVLYNQIAVLENVQQMKSWLLESIEKIIGSMNLEQKVTINSYVMDAITYVNQNFSKDISLEGTAEVIGISSYYLSRLFKQELNQNFVEYLTEVRIKKAITLIESTRMSIKEIAERVGYLNPTYFCKVLKKNTGKTIREIRELQWKNQF